MIASNEELDTQPEWQWAAHRPMIRRGLLNGALAALIGSAFGPVGIILASFIYYLHDPSYPLWSDSVEADLIASIVVFVVAVALSLLPASLGGALNAIATILLRPSTRIRLWASLCMGALGGIFWGIVVYWLFSLCFYGAENLNWSYRSPDTQERIQLAVYFAVCSALGCWHSWRLSRYLQAFG